MAISAGFGVVIGSVAGYYGGKIDNIVMRFLDIIQAFPQILLAIALSAAFGTGFDKCILALGLSGIPNFARLMRANILTIRDTEYVEAATSINCSSARIKMCIRDSNYGSKKTPEGDPEERFFQSHAFYTFHL